MSIPQEESLTDYIASIIHDSDSGLRLGSGRRRKSWEEASDPLKKQYRENAEAVMRYVLLPILQRINTATVNLDDPEYAVVIVRHDLEAILGDYDYGDLNQ